jgi:muramoyltetrapeptide carboxypeptidase
VKHYIPLLWVKDSCMQPPFLQSGDTIGIVSTARWVSPEQLAPAIALFESWGLRVKVAPNVGTKTFQLAGNDATRLADLQAMLDDKEVKAIIISRGGYGTVRLIDQIDWTFFDQNPKWIAGYSDITVLLNRLSNQGFSAIHSTMPISFPDATKEALDNLKAALFGELNEMTWEGGLFAGQAEGEIVGGNLSVIYSQLGSATQLKAKGKILFLEDVDEMLYHTDRMLMGLKRAGVLDGIVGLIAGGFTQMKDNTLAFGFSLENPWGADVEDMFREFFGPMGVPVASQFPAGHLADNRAFYMGKKASLKVDNKNCRLVFPV